MTDDPTRPLPRAARGQEPTGPELPGEEGPTPRTRALREERPPQNEWGGILLRLAVAVLVLGGAYVGLAFWAGSHVAQNTKVHGVDIGGATKEDAAKTLRDRLGPTLAKPVKVTLDGQQAFSVDPGAAGVEMDTDATLDGLTGVSFHPVTIWERLTGGGDERELVVRRDDGRLRELIAQQSEKLKVEPREGSVTFSQGTVEKVDAKPGRELDVDATASAVQDSLLSERPVDAVVTQLEPKLPQAEIDRFADGEAATVVSGPVTLSIGSQKATLDRGKITSVVGVENKEGKLALTVDEAALAKQVRTAAPKAETKPVDASVKLAAGGPQITPEKTGQQMDTASLRTEFTNAVTRDTPRSGTVKLSVAKPKTTAAQLKGMNLKTPMTEFRSVFPGGAENAGRTHNIKIGLAHLDGLVIQPGEQFSLLKQLGAMDESQGYVDAGVIISGMPAQAMAGGLSQVSTVVYNASYFAGVQLDEHTAHSYYIDRYPEGREATIWGEQIDNKWTNNTKSPIVIEAHIEGNEVVMRFWGQKVYEVESVKSARYNVTQPTAKTNPAANCEPSHGTDVGFTVTVTRILKQGGKVVKKEPVTTTYIPSDSVVCTNPNAPGYGK